MRSILGVILLAVFACTLPAQNDRVNNPELYPTFCTAEGSEPGLHDKVEFVPLLFPERRITSTLDDDLKAEFVTYITDRGDELLHGHVFCRVGIGKQPKSADVVTSGILRGRRLGAERN